MLPNETDALLTEGETATFLKVSKSCLRKWRRLGKGPRYSRLCGKIIRYREGDLENFLAGNLTVDHVELARAR